MGKEIDIKGYGWLNDYVRDTLPLTDEQVEEFYRKIKDCRGVEYPQVCVMVDQETIDQMVADLGYEYTKAWLDGDIDLCADLARED